MFRREFVVVSVMGLCSCSAGRRRLFDGVGVACTFGRRVGKGVDLLLCRSVAGISRPPLKHSRFASRRRRFKKWVFESLVPRVICTARVCSKSGNTIPTIISETQFLVDPLNSLSNMRFRVYV